MALKNTKTKKGMGGFSNEYRTYRSTYKFSEDGGLFADEYTLLEGDQDMVIVGGYVHVKDAVLSAGAPTMVIGIEGGDVDKYMTSKLKAALLTGTIFPLAAAGLNALLVTKPPYTASSTRKPTLRSISSGNTNSFGNNAAAIDSLKKSRRFIYKGEGIEPPAR